MMYRIQTVLFLFIILWMGCSCAKKKKNHAVWIEIHGEVINPPSAWVILERFTRGNYIKEDSITLTREGRFNFSLGSVEYNYCAINFPGAGRLPIVLGDGELFIKADFQGDEPQFTVSGAPNMDDIFVVQKIKNFFTGFKPGFKNVPAEAHRGPRVAEDDRKKNGDGEHTFHPGTPVPDLILPNPDGIEVALADFKGKTVLVDFWAAWCKPCREAHPALRQLYARYQNRGFEILSVSLDRNRDQWMKAIREDSLTWSQISDLKYFDSDVIENFGIEFIPSNLLVDAQGMIVARNITADSVSKQLQILIGQ